LLKMDKKILLVVGLIVVIGAYIYLSTQEVKCEYKGWEGKGSIFYHIIPFEESLHMSTDGTLTFSVMNGAGSPANITNMEIVYLGKRCQKEAVCQIQNFDGKIKMKTQEVLEITANCPDVYQEVGTEAYTYMRIDYEREKFDEGRMDTGEGLVVFPVRKS